MAGGDFWLVLAAQRKTACDALRNAGPVVEINGVYPLGRAVARPAVDRPEVVESRLGQSQLILKPGCVAPVRGILSGLGLAPYLADTTM